jgi:hypothetical protein
MQQFAFTYIRARPAAEGSIARCQVEGEDYGSAGARSSQMFVSALSS